MNQQLVLALLHRVFPGPYRFEVDTHSAVEMTLFHQPHAKRLLAGLLNCRSSFRKCPSRPRSACSRPRATGSSAYDVCQGRNTSRSNCSGPYVQFHVDPFQPLAMFAIDYE